MAVVDALSRAAGEPGTSAVATPLRRWTYRELGALVDERVDELRGAGVEPGSTAPLVVEADLPGVVALLAVWRIGAVAAPLSPRLTEAERSAALRVLGEAAPHGAQAVLWTSGSEGRPRGVALSWRNLEASAYAAADRLSLGPDDVWLASLSLAHVGGLALLTRSLLLGCTLVAAGRFDAEVSSGLIDGAVVDGAPLAISHASLVPTQLLRLLDHRRGAPPPATFRCALIGGAHASSRLIERAHRARWPLALTYGATEMCSQIATAPPDQTRRKPGTVGRPLAGVELRVRADGEVLARGDTCALGYLGGSGALAPITDAEGWYRTGDLGRLDEEGDLWIVGRRSDRIVSGGVTVDAVEVEEALRSHPSVIDACVVGVPDEEWGELIAAWVEPVAGEFDVDEVEHHLRGLISAPKLPRRWHLGPSLPRTGNGKPDRAKVRAVLEQA